MCPARQHWWNHTKGTPQQRGFTDEGWNQVEDSKVVDIRQLTARMCVTALTSDYVKLCETGKYDTYIPLNVYKVPIDRLRGSVLRPGKIVYGSILLTVNSVHRPDPDFGRGYPVHRHERVLRAVALRRDGKYTSIESSRPAIGVYGGWIKENPREVERLRRRLQKESHAK